MATTATWGVGRWGTDTWGTRLYPPGAVWKDDWRWWYQYGTATQAGWDLTGLVVEARWTTDGHTMGDGTFRGDVQPGRLELQLCDRHNLVAGLDQTGTVWARFNPTGATWCWFVHDITHLLTAPGEHGLGVYDYVLSADAWPARLTTKAYSAARPFEWASDRLTAIVNRLGSDAGLRLPAVSGVIAQERYYVAPIVADALGQYPGFLDQIRTAAANGVAWLAAISGPTAYTPGSLVLHYAHMETVTARALDPAQVTADTLWTFGLDHIITHVSWSGDLGQGAPTVPLDQLGQGYGVYGTIQLGPMRVLGDLSAQGGTKAAVTATGNQILVDHGAPASRVDQIIVTSGDRTHPATGLPAKAWDPAHNVWSPVDVMQWHRVGGPTGPLETYRVTQTEHRLTATVWESTHHLEMFTSPTALPP